MVTTDTNQNISGLKNIKNELQITPQTGSQMYHGIQYINKDVTYDQTPSTSIGDGGFQIADKNGVWYSIFSVERITNGEIRTKVQGKGVDNTQHRLQLCSYSDGTACSRTDYRNPPLLADEIITKGNLEGSDHTFTGINTFNTVKFNSNPQKIYNGSIDERPSQYVVCGDIQFMDNSNAVMGFLRRDKTATNERTLVYTRAKIGNDFIGGRLMIEVTPQGIVVLSIAKETNTATTQTYEIWRSTQ